MKFVTFWKKYVNIIYPLFFLYLTISLIYNSWFKNSDASNNTVILVIIMVALYVKDSKFIVKDED